jgi:RimJ/RimL family protein N-acetyltransferase
MNSRAAVHRVREVLLSDSQRVTRGGMAEGFVMQSARLRLREFDVGLAQDLAELMAMHREPRVRALLVDDYPFEQEAVSRFFLQRMQVIYREHEGLGIWHAERRDPASGRWLFCGWFNLMPMPDDPGRVEIGCRLMPDAWGHGLAVEGGDLLLAQAFTSLQLPAVWGICHPEHHAVHAVLDALGFAGQGVLEYCGQPAAHFAAQPAAWQAAAALPMRERLRQAVARQRSRHRPRVRSARSAESLAA